MANLKLWFLTAILMSFLAVGFFFGPATIRIVTNKGILVVEAEDKSVEVTIKGEEVTILEPGTKRVFTLKAGENQEIHLREHPDGIAVATRNVRLDRNGKVIVNARLELERPVPGLSPPIVTTLPHPNPDDKDGRSGSMAFSADGTRLLAATGKTVVLWDWVNRKQLWTFKTREPGGVALSPDGTRVFSGGGHIPLQILDAKTGEKIRTLGDRPHDAEVVFDAVFLPDNRRILVSHRDFHAGPSTIRLWDTETGKELRSYPGHTSYAWQLALAADGKRFASSGHLEKVARLWDIEKKDALRAFDDHAQQVGCVALTSDGQRLATGSADGIVRLYQIDEKTGAQQLRGHDRHVAHLWFSSNGKRLYSSDIRKLFLWNAETGEKIKEWDMPSYNGYFVLSRDDKLLAIGNKDGSISIYQIDRLK